MRFYTYGIIIRVPDCFNDKVEGPFKEADFIFEYRKNGEMNREALILQPHSRLHRQERRQGRGVGQELLLFKNLLQILPNARR